MKSEDRTIFHSILTKEGWAVKEEGVDDPVEIFETQAEAEEAAVKRGRETSGLSQVIFHKENGEIREESTYGKDPRAIPG